MVLIQQNSVPCLNPGLQTLFVGPRCHTNRPQAHAAPLFLGLFPGLFPGLFANTVELGDGWCWRPWRMLVLSPPRDQYPSHERIASCWAWKLYQHQYHLTTLEKHTSRGMSLRTLNQKLVSQDSLIYTERHTFTQNEVKRDENEIVWHRIIL